MNSNHDNQIDIGFPIEIEILLNWILLAALR